MSVKTPEGDDNANEIDVERIMEEVKQVPSQLREQLIQQVIITVGDAHMATVRPTYERVAEANERFVQKIQDHGMVSYVYVLFLCIFKPLQYNFEV